MRDQPLPPEVLASRPRTEAEREYIDTLERVGDADAGGVMAGGPPHPLRPLSPEDYAGVSVPTLEQLREARERGRAEMAKGRCLRHQPRADRGEATTIPAMGCVEDTASVASVQIETLADKWAGAMRALATLNHETPETTP